MAQGVTSSITSDITFTSKYQLTANDDTLIIQGATVTLLAPQGEIFTNEGNDTVFIEGATITTKEPNLALYLGSGDDRLSLKKCTLTVNVSMFNGDDVVVVDGSIQTQVILNKKLTFGEGNDVLELISMLYNAGSIDFGSSGIKTLRFNGGALLGPGSIGNLTNLDVTLSGGTTGSNLTLSGEQTGITLNGNMFGTTPEKDIIVSGGTTTLAVVSNIRTNVRLKLNQAKLIHVDGAILEFSDHSGYAVTADESIVDLHDIVVKGGMGLDGTNTVWTVSNCDFSNSTNAISLTGGTLDFRNGGMTNYTSTAMILNGASLTGSKMSLISNQGQGAMQITSGGIEVTNFRANSNYTNTEGGAVSLNGGNMALTNANCSGNSARAGGAIYHTNGDMTLTSVVFSGNRVSGSNGGAIYHSGGNMTMTSATFSGNRATSMGGAVYHCGGTMTMTSAIFSGNSAYYGGAVFQNGGVMTLSNIVFSGNSGNSGGAILHSAGVMSLKNATFSGNKEAVYVCYGIANMESTSFLNNSGTAIYLKRMTLNYVVAPQERIANKNNSGGWLYIGDQSTANITVENEGVLTIGDSNNQDSIGGTSDSRITKQGAGYILVNSDISGYKGLWTIAAGTLELARISRTIHLDEWTIGTDATLVLSEKNDTINMSMNKKVGIIDMGGGADTINTSGYDLTDGTVLLSDLTLGGGGRISVQLRNRSITEGSTLRLNDIYLDSEFTGNDYTDTILINQESTLNGAIDLKNGNNVIQASALARFGSTLKMGAGNDELSFTAVTFEDTIELGNGDNSLTATGPAVFSGTLNAGRGADTLGFAEVTFLENTDLGDGDNSLTATGTAKLKGIATGTGADTLSFADVTFEDYVDLGDGDNSLTATDRSKFTKTLATGTGADTLSFADVTFEDSVSLGDGNNSLTATGTLKMQGISGGSGTDTISLNETSTIYGEIDLGSGINSIYIRKNLTADKVRITEGGETTIYVYYGTTLIDNTLTVYGDEESARDTITLNWSAQTDLDKVRILVSKDATFQSYEFSVELYNQSKSFTLNLEQGYFIQFQAQDEDGWKQRLLDDTVAPNQVTGVQFNGAALSWDATHDNLGGNGVKQYHVEVATDASFTNLIASEIVTGTQYAPATLAESTLYFRVSAEDYTNNIGAWSETVTGMFDNTPPARPTGGKSTVDGYSVNLSWSAASDTGSGVARYEYRIASDSDYGVIVTDGTTETCSITVDSLKYGTYYWQVRAIDVAGNECDWSLSKSFSTADTVAPGIPANLDYGIEDGSTLIVIWDAVTDDSLGSGLNRYEIQLANEADFATIVKSFSVTVPEITIEELAKGDYFMRVCAVDNVGNKSAWTPTETFIIDIDTTPPTITNVQASITEPTNQDVMVTATFADNVAMESAQYRIGKNGVWTDYKYGVTVTENTTVYFRAVDTSGNATVEVPFVVSNIDKTPPEKPTSTADITTPTRGSVIVTAMFSDDSVIQEYSTDGQTWAEYTEPIVFDMNGTVFFRGTDAVENVSEATVFTVSNIDLIPPEKPVASADITAPTNQNVTVIATFSDDSYKKEYSLDGKLWMTYSADVTMEDNGTLYFRGTDEAGNVSDVTDFLVSNIDTIAPDVPIASADITTMTNTDVMVSATFSADSVLHEYSLDGTTWKPYTAPIRFSQNGVVYFRGTDAAGNTSEQATYTVSNIDKEPPFKPTVSADVTETTYGRVKVSAVFSGDSVKKEYSLDNGDTWLDYTAPIEFTANGTVLFRGIDAADNVSEVTSYEVANIETVIPDTTKPTITNAKADITVATNQNVTVTAEFADDVELAKSLYRIGEADEWKDYTDGVILSENATVFFKAVDAAGNESEVVPYTVGNIDKVAPSAPSGLMAVVSDPTVVLIWSPCTDDASGIKEYVVKYTHNGQEFTVMVNNTNYVLTGIASGTWNWSVQAIDNVGNLSEAVAGNAFTVGQTAVPEPEPEPEKTLFFTGDFNGDGKDMLAVQSGKKVTVCMNGEPWGTGLTLEDGWENAGVGDFNADGLDDFLRINDEGYVVGEMTKLNGKFSPQVLNFLNAGWSILGTGDFNGNGSDDVLIANPTAASDTVGLLGYWESGVTWTLINGYSAEWEMIATDDFNADGKCDMLWKNSFVGAGDLVYNAYCTWIVEDPVDWRMVSVANPTEWNFLCAGDFNADGANDIAMINDVGVVGIWGVEDGWLSSWSILSAVDTSAWTLAGVGDFNADGMDDIAWVNNASGMAGYWQIKDKNLASWQNIATIS